LGNDIETAAEYRAKAAEARAKAAEVKNDLSLRDMLLRIALDYERMARGLELLAEARDTWNRRSDRD
jgi:hypothetical protein